MKFFLDAEKELPDAVHEKSVCGNCPELLSRVRSNRSVIVSRMTMVLMVVAGAILLCASISGFVTDAEVSSARLGSDFADARYHQFDDLSIERAEQRTRREKIGMEGVGGVGLILTGMVFFTPKRKPATKRAAMPGQAAKQPPPAQAARPPRPSAALPIPDPYVGYRRRPNSSLHTSAGRAK